MHPARPTERRLALSIVLVSLAVFAAAAPFAQIKLARITAFIPAYEAALIITDLITATLLYGQFAIARSPALLVLAAAYLFTALMTVAHGLTFPGVFSDTGLLGAGAQSTAWLYMFWHGGFPLAIVLYAVLERRHDARLRRPAAAALGSILAVVLLTVALVDFATAGEAELPRIMAGNGYTPMLIYVVGVVWSLSFLALAMLLWRRSPSLLDLWLMVVLCAWICDVALSAVLNAGRFDLGFYVGRFYGLCASSLILVVLMLEIIALYARQARSLEAAAEERERHLGELRSELIHVSRLSELGQMVSALAHEVSQPLTAVGNYVRASQRLIEAGDPAKARAALEKAGDETSRAVKIIRRLRDFLKKGESERRAEDIAAMIEETLSLALVGAAQHEVGLELGLYAGAATALIDKIEIQQVLLNLIRNAVEAMAERPHQRLRIATAPTADGMIEISVADNGPGLPAEVRERLFQPFVTTKPQGMGVGLSICRSIVEGQGGRLWAEENQGGGTVFRFTVPRAPAAEDKSAAD